METIDEITIWKEMAVEDVRQAKELQYLSHSFLLYCIDLIRDIFSKENPYSSPQHDIRYRSYVLKVLSECQRQELPNYENLLMKVFLGKQF